MIPKLIHYCWVGRNPLPETVLTYLASWKRHCPGYEIRQWNEENFDVTQNRYCREAYDAMKWAFVTDYARLRILYDHGGIYMDSDVEVVKSLDPLLQYDAFSGFESTQGDRIPTGTMGAVAGNEWIECLLHDYDDKRFLLDNGEFDLTTNVIFITELTKAKFNLRLDGTKHFFGPNMVMLPFDYLCAKDLDTGEICSTDNTYTIHHFAGSWLGPLVQYRLNTKNRWIQAANNIPWKALENRYSDIFQGLNAPFKVFRLMLGILLIQDCFGFSDEEMLEQFAENKYFQWFCGVEKPIEKAPLDVSVLEYVHTQCTPQKLEEIKCFVAEN